jgi:hypothetical protein
MNKKFLNGKFVRLIAKIKIMWRNTNIINTERESNQYEKTCKAICRKLISHSESKFMIAPISSKRYIVNKTLGMFIVFEDNKIEITNHVYHYIVRLSDVEIDKLIDMFDRKTEQIRLKFEDEIMSQIKNSLSSILEKIEKTKL